MLLCSVCVEFLHGQMVMIIIVTRIKHGDCDVMMICKLIFNSIFLLSVWYYLHRIREYCFSYSLLGSDSIFCMEIEGFK